MEQRGQIAVLLEDSPSLVRRVPEAISTELVRARELAGADLSDFAEPTPNLDDLAFTPEQVLGPWLPD